jgi:hypothetical protein
MSFDDNPYQMQLRDFHFRLRETWVYEYDLADWWQQEIRLEQVLPFDPTKRYPICLAGKRRGPIEGCGGPWAFMELQDEYPLWKALPQFAQLLLDHHDDLDDYQDELRRLAYWVVREDFDRQAVNHRLTEYGAVQAGEKGNSHAYPGTSSH